MSLCRLALTVAAALGVAGPALTQGAPSALIEAQSQGIVGERFDGFLGYAVRPSSEQIRAQTEAVNIRRRALYTGLASRRGVSPQDVGIAAGCTLLGRVAVGEAYMLSDGVWRRRIAGQAPPVPDYCSRS